MIAAPAAATAAPKHALCDAAFVFPPFSCRDRWPRYEVFAAYVWTDGDVLVVAVVVGAVVKVCGTIVGIHVVVVGVVVGVVFVVVIGGGYARW